MSKNALAPFWVVVFICILGNLAAAEEIAYRFRPTKFDLPARGVPQSGVVLADAAIGKPLGLATTIAGTGLFIATLPMTLPSRSVRESAWQLVGRPGGWTFARPLGKPDLRFDEKRLTEP